MITEPQTRALRAVADARPIAGNDDGWVFAYGVTTRPMARRLVALGLIESSQHGYIGPTSGQCHRITTTGRAALAAALQEQEG